MKILRFNSQNYRNLRPGEHEFGSKINIICGNNAQGKTNLIEALWMFTGGHSFRGAKDSELVLVSGTEKPQNAWISIDFFSGEREQSAKIVFQNGKRTAEINGIIQKSAVSLVGRFCAVIFSPEHLSLIKGGPSGRRMFLDAALCQMKPSYAETLTKYNRSLQQRNALLKDLMRHPELSETLDLWDNRMVHFGSKVMYERMIFLKNLRPFAEEAYGGISRNREKFTLEYRPSAVKLGTGESHSEQTFSEIFKESLKKQRKTDLSSGFTSCGPHRDDLEFLLNDLSARSFGSQGQQRSIVLALKLAESQILYQMLGEPPVIFLDDVMSELDEGRQEYLLNHLKDRQVFLTCCDIGSLNKLSGGNVFTMGNGVLTKK